MKPRKRDGIGAWIEYHRMRGLFRESEARPHPAAEPAQLATPAPLPPPSANPSPIEIVGDGSARVLLKGGMFAVIDEADAGLVGQFAWRACKHGRTVYARTSGWSGARSGMHQILLRHAAQVDHRDGDGLNNRRSNLRPSTQMQNRCNSAKMARPATSRFKGVSASRNRFHAYITFNGVTESLGYFATEEEAARAYDRAALQSHGEFARLNFPAVRRIEAAQSEPVA